MKKEDISIEDVFFGIPKFVIAYIKCFEKKASETLKSEDIKSERRRKYTLLQAEIKETISFMIKEGNLSILFELFDEIEEKIHPTILNFSDFDIFFVDKFIDVLTKSNRINISPTNKYYIQVDNTKNEIKSINESVLTNYQLNVRKLKKYNEWDYIHWGKYSEKKISDILNIDPNYILWSIINLEHFALSGTFFLMKRIRHNSLLLKGLEINEIKKIIIDKWEVSTNHEYDNESWEDSRFYDGFEGDIDTWNHYNQ